MKAIFFIVRTNQVIFNINHGAKGLTQPHSILLENSAESASGACLGPRSIRLLGATLTCATSCHSLRAPLVCGQ